MIWEAVERDIARATGISFRVANRRELGGGCINDAFCIEGGGQSFFVKLNQAELLPMFEAEAAGLEAIVASGTVRAPQPIIAGRKGDLSYLVLEHLAFGPALEGSSALLGEQLAAMHRVSSQSFGWYRDNTIGSTAQINTPGTDWVSFWREQRLGYQLHLAQQHGASATLIDRGQHLLESLPLFFTDYRPTPSLLHGDLWGGNWSVDSTGSPVVFDPAVYFGDREADLAMTELFGGFDDRFYQSYRHAWTWDAGYDVRKVLYNLYHILNHFNLFGGSYARQAESMINRLIADVS